MKKVIPILLLLVLNNSFAQETPKETIENFFIAFHAQDTIGIKKECYQEIMMQTIAVKSDENILKTENFNNFLKSIATIPKNINFQEKILKYKIRIDGAIAHVWTPYQFYINEKISHKGVNSFTLIKTGTSWKIVHLIDTREK